jgi:peptidoglycan/LPS O-acetylase OafA/YrhL
MESLQSNKVYFANLDLLRFVAVLMVVLTHAYQGWCGWYGYPKFMTVLNDGKTLTHLGLYLHNLFKNSAFGVDVFFLISGFLITYILLREKEATGKINFKFFFIRRGLKIWPLYFALIAVTPFLVHWLHKPKPDYFAAMFFYNNFQTMQTGYCEYPFPHFWSICVEEHFYLVWPFLVAFVPNKHLLNTFLSVILISIFSRFGFSLYNKGYYYQFFHTLSRMDVLAIGAIGAYLHFTNSLKFILPKYSRLSLYVLFIIIFAFEPYNMYDGVFLSCFRKYFYVSIVAIGMINFLFNPDALIKIHKKTVFHYFGKISFGIYLFSNFFVIIIIEKIIARFNFVNLGLYFFLNIFFSLIIPIISYELFEKQFLKLKSKFEIINTQR